jgi:hypothetical protein
MARLLLALAAAVLVGGAFAEDKKPVEDKKPATDKADDDKKGPAGVWTKKSEEGLTLQLDFTKKDTLVVTNSLDDKQLVITCKLSVDKDGKYTAKATKVENKNEFPVTVSDSFEMTFKLKVDKDAVTVSDFGANEHEDQAKGVVEGEYKKKEDK